MSGISLSMLLIVATALVAADGAVAQDLPDSIRAPGETAFLTLHAEGAQIYECEADQAGKLAWTFREPIATLLQDGKTVGRHYAGPQWELSDGGIVQGKVSAKAPGAAPSDIPWLKLDAAAQKGHGALSDAVTIQRVNTHGGALEGACDAAGAFRSVAYSADYIFLRK